MPVILEDGLRRNVWGNGLAYAVDTSGNPLVYHTDGLGSVRALTDVSGTVAQSYQYDEYGNVLSSSGSITQPFQYTGEQRDETGLLYLRARMYDPYLNRFIQSDTILADPTNTQDLNRYAYARGNPLVYTDPSGHFVLFVGGMGTGNDPGANMRTWKEIMRQMRLDPGHPEGTGEAEDWGFFDWGNEPGASCGTVSLADAAARLDRQVAGKTNIKIIGHSRGGALAMEYAAEVAERRFLLESEDKSRLRGVYSIDGALNPLDSVMLNPIAAERYTMLWQDRYANLGSSLASQGITADLATFDNKADFFLTTHDSLPGTTQYDFMAPGQGPNAFWQQYDAHGILLRESQYDVGGIIYRRTHWAE